MLRTGLQITVQHRVVHVAAVEICRGLEQQSGDVDGDVAGADDHRVVAELGQSGGLIRVAVEGAGEGTGSEDPWQICAGDRQRAVCIETGREHDDVERGPELVERHILSDLDVARESHAPVEVHPLELSRDRLGVLMIGSHAVTDEPEGSAKTIEDDDLGQRQPTPKRAGDVAAARPAAHNGDLRPG